MTESKESTEIKESPLKIKSWDEMFRARCVLMGIDPNQVQGMAKFMDADKVDETTFYPNQLTSLAVAQLRLYGQAFYRNQDWNEYDLAANLIGQGFKGLKGFKSNQWVEATSGQQNLEKLQGLSDETKKGVLANMFNRGKSKE